MAAADSAGDHSLSLSMHAQSRKLAINSGRPVSAANLPVIVRSRDLAAVTTRPANWVRYLRPARRPATAGSAPSDEVQV
jgi:hypothetical protein